MTFIGQNNGLIFLYITLLLFHELFCISYFRPTVKYLFKVIGRLMAGTTVTT